jgi:tetrahydromethanopterin S-methyltransferase subunit E
LGTASECRINKFYTYSLRAGSLSAIYCDLKIQEMERDENSSAYCCLRIGHVLSSLILGFIGVFLGWQLNKISWFQDIRGNFSGWALLIFGGVYLVYGLIQAIRNKPHKHFDVMGDDVYVYEHNHSEMVMPQKRIKVTPLVLFMIL